MRDLDKAFVNYLKECGINPEMFQPVEFDETEIAKLYARNRITKEWFKQNSNKIVGIFSESGFMDPNKILKDNAPQIEIILRNNGFSTLLDNILTCELPTRQFNACATILGNGYGLFVNTGMFRKLGKLSILATAALKGIGFDDDGPFITLATGVRFDAAQAGIFLLVSEYFGRIPCKDTNTVDTLADYENFDDVDLYCRAYLLGAMDYFIIFHELGHIIAGHLNKDSLTYNAIDIDGGKLRIAIKSHEEEFEADRLAIKMLLGHIGPKQDLVRYLKLTKRMNEETEQFRFHNDEEELFKKIHFSNLFPPEWIIISLIVFFYFAELINYYAEVHIGFSSDDSTHPAPRQRLELAMEYIATELEGFELSSHNSIRHWLSWVELSRKPMYEMINERDEAERALRNVAAEIGSIFKSA